MEPILGHPLIREAVVSGGISMTSSDFGIAAGWGTTLADADARVKSRQHGMPSAAVFVNALPLVVVFPGS